ncbi:YshB family small membrane protein [Brenneria goodwinii]|uniref:YshB family small membrane protein n=1 Tax=Brenneria goodwinii TaxID=1109412 RepID=A0A0G4JSZ5_9GAMM|nr:YshB family small membrane protein [Brenneria goodwinii]MCG8155866.1 YshB family small membrane protein [Brenneria goodwinii]MCG8162259.1 YshB family small membrane protein [Brenneria goodwinii]MCG8167020.1 YshB family small membrane protein [Brenneria goodwinii]MCG8169694.1 YshB family small membrane protein [Brenneria goodwinii]MCG8174700.1 YshB family small membrane protein [Brenneria goodwinii]
MLDSLISMVTHGAEIGSAASHTPQTAIAAILCAALINFFS